MTPLPLLADTDWLHIDDTCCVLNKPAGLPSVPGRGDLALGSLAQQVQQRLSDALVVHRLDMATSGVILLARGSAWQRMYSQLFANRLVQKNYVAVVHGWMHHDRGEIKLPLIADWPNRPKQKVDPVLGKPSLTRYHVLARDEGLMQTRLSLQPVTGRSHQLRVHLLAIGHPIVGDALYAPPADPTQAPRLLLHAEELALTHPLSAEPMVWRAEVGF
jgi:tRNA pseudouridine32 synthase/23S rRNA pseudouridine746 synthase